MSEQMNQAKDKAGKLLNSVLKTAKQSVDKAAETAQKAGVTDKLKNTVNKATETAKSAVSAHEQSSGTAKQAVNFSNKIKITLNKVLGTVRTKATKVSKVKETETQD